MHCKTCHSHFDPEVVLEKALSGNNDDIFWVCIFANDIGAPPKPGSDETYHLTDDAVRKMNVTDIPVRYFHCSDPIGRVLFGWHIHWVGRRTYACACVATISKASFEAAASVLLTVACQSSLGTINNVPDEISITQIGARDDTVGVFCRRNSLRDLLTCFGFLTADGTEPIKRDHRRATGIQGSRMDSESTSTSSAVPTVASQSGSSAPARVDAEQMATTGAATVALEGNEAENGMSEIEGIVHQVTDIRRQLQEQAEVLNMTRGVLEETALKSLAELKASEASGERKVRKDIEHMIKEGVIRNIDKRDQPNVPHADAVHALVKYNIERFPGVLAKSFCDAVEGVLGPTASPSSSSSSSSSESDDADGDETIPSIGTSLVAVRATALRARVANEERKGTSVPDVPPQRASTLVPARQTPSKRMQSPSLQVIHQALSQRLAPGRKRDRDPGPYLSAYSRDCREREENVSESKIRKIIRDTIQGELRQWGQVQQSSREEDEQRALFDDFRHFLEQRQLHQRNSTPTQLQTTPCPPAAPTTAQTPAPAEQSPTVSPPAQQTPNAQDTVRASGLSLQATSPEEDTNVNLKDLGIFY